MSSATGRFFKALVRRKQIETSSIIQTRLDRCLSTLDLTALGVGSTLGLGIYVLAGEIASRTAGPSVTISFFVAAVASVFAGLCYAEFGARVPKAGSAYVYSYVTVGEFMAFVIGWNLILEYVIGTASVARGYSLYIDSLANGTFQEHFKEWMPMNVAGFSKYPDFLAFGITLLLTVMLAVGVKESTRFNSVFTGLNLLVVLVVVIGGSYHLDFHNWDLSKNETCHDPLKPAEEHPFGTGGFMPYGFSGMMAGAATAFYAFIGFDVIATTGEEAKNPQRSIPISIVVSLFLVFLAYFGTSAVQTLMVPYCLLHTDFTKGAPLPFVFDYVGWPSVSWVIKVGALTGLSTSLLGAMFPLPRVLYAMASDGLIFRFLSDVHPRFKTPLLATVISGVFAGFMGAIFDIQELADMMSIGTLLAYSLVAVSVLILRYRLDADQIGLSNSDSIPSNSPETDPLKASAESEYKEAHLKMLPSAGSDDSTASPYSPADLSTSTSGSSASVREVFRQTYNLDQHKTPTKLSSKLSIWLIILICLVLVLLCSLLVGLEHRLAKTELPSLIGVSLVVVVLIGLLLSLRKQPSCAKRIAFQVPCVPLVPVLSMFVNFYLMLKLSTMTWIRFGVWMFFGLFMYFLYGVVNSTGHLPDSVARRMLDRRRRRRLRTHFEEVPDGHPDYRQEHDDESMSNPPLDSHSTSIQECEPLLS